MVEQIILCISKAIVLLISVTLYLKLFSSIIPGFIMRVTCKKEATRDRGIKKFIYENGRCVVYEPELNIRKYVKKYALYTEDGYKYIQCKVSECVKYLRYDVYAFDNSGKLIDVINVNDTVEEGGEYTSAVALPPETSYTRLVLRKVDAQYSFNGVLLEYSSIRYALCGALIALTTAVESTIIYITLRDILVALFDRKSRYIVAATEEIIPAIIIITCLVTGLTLLAYYRNAKKVINR